MFAQVIVILFYSLETCRGYLSDFCPRHMLVDQGKLNRRDALRGFNVSAGLQSHVVDKSTGKYDQESKPYFAVEVFNEIAQRAGFNWMDSYGVVAAPTKNETWTTALNKTLNQYDIATDYWNIALERLATGIVFPHPWYDVSLIMIQNTKDLQVETNLFAFMEPFSASVWTLIAFTIVFTALVYCVIHNLNRRNRQGIDVTLGETLFQTFSAFTGQNGLESNYFTNKIVIASLIFWSLLIVNAYVANLTSFLVNRNVSNIENFEEVIGSEYSICILRAGQAEIELRKEYSSGNYILKEELLDIFSGVNSGECKIGIYPKADFQKDVSNKKYNPDCSLEWVGRKVTSDMASFALRDSQERCSSLLRNILDMYLVEIMEDKTLDQIMTKQYKNKSCIDASQVAEDSDRLNVKDVAGIFVFHFLLLLFAGAMAICQCRNTQLGSTVKRASIEIEDRFRRSLAFNEEEEETEANVNDDPDLFSEIREMHNTMKGVLVELKNKTN